MWFQLKERPKYQRFSGRVFCMPVRLDRLLLASVSSVCRQGDKSSLLREITLTNHTELLSLGWLNWRHTYKRQFQHVPLNTFHTAWFFCYHPCWPLKSRAFRTSKVVVKASEIGLSFYSAFVWFQSRRGYATRVKLRQSCYYSFEHNYPWWY